LDKVVEAAKAEGSMTFYAWWGEEFWRTAAKDFEAKYGIAVNVVTGDRPANIARWWPRRRAPKAPSTLLVGGVS
jgi:ABC-type glycerol-3-phosphate transport system substrate-binding protein